MFKHKALILSVVLFLVEAGLQVSGINNLTYAIIIWGIAALLALYVIFGYAMEWRAKRKHLGLPLMEPSHLILFGGIGTFLCAGVMLAGILWQQFWPPSSTKQDSEVVWLIPMEAIARFADPTLVKQWRIDPNKPLPENLPEIASKLTENIQNQLLNGQLVARGLPHYRTAQETQPILINAAQWQTLTLRGKSFSDASDGNPTHAYESLEISKPANSSTVSVKADASIIKSPLTTEETQFRLELRKFILSNVTEINKTFSRMDGGLLNTLATNSHEAASDNLKFSRDMLQRYIEVTMYQRYIQLYEAANKPIETFDVKEFGENLKSYFDGYRQAQDYFRAFLKISGIHPNKDNLLTIWLEADSRALHALHDLKASPQAEILAGIDDGYFPTRTGTFASYFPKDK
jgi:hypothetical protein